jgi:pyridoxal 5'-phosphate synthase pdxT subunit
MSSSSAPNGAAPAPPAKPLVGVLALQGGFEAHARMLRALGAQTRELRAVGDLEGVEGLVLPGGESTTMTLGIARERLAQPLRELVAGGVPVLGSCAGLIMLDREHLALMDMRAERNAFGRQLHSFETDLDVRGLAGGPLRAVFIRAPQIAEHGPAVEVLAEVEGHPVAALQESMLAVAFHAELTADDRIHRMFLERVRDSTRSPEMPRAS